MGYTITVPCVSEEAKAKMLAFLSEHYRSPDTLIKGYEPDDGLSAPHGGPFAYYDGECEIGIDYSSWAGTKDFANAIISWIALRVGKRKTLLVYDTQSGLSSNIPYYIYDGEEDIPIRLKEHWYEAAPESCKNWTFVDEHGWNVIKPKGFKALFMCNSKSERGKLHGELKRLSLLWLKQETK